MEFLNEKHENNFCSLMKRGSISKMDVERTVLMYIISGNDALNKRVSEIYSFTKRCIICKTDSTTGNPIFSQSFSSSELALIRLGFNLYSGGSFDDGHITPFDLFFNLNKENAFLALQAIKILFGWA